MIITPVSTERVATSSISLTDLIDSHVGSLPEASIVAITSKVVSLCEGSVVPIGSISKESLALQQSQYFLPATYSNYGHHFTITGNTLIAMAGIDESNGDGDYILWPKDAQATANAVREHLAARHGVQQVGVIITDSTCQPMRRGTTGIALAHSGFLALKDYRDEPDLFGRPFHLTQSNISGGLAAGAVVAMGEGAERTPLCLLSDLPFVEFQARNPSEAELAEIRITLADDLFAPFLQSAPWQPGQAAG